MIVCDKCKGIIIELGELPVSNPCSCSEKPTTNRQSTQLPKEIIVRLADFVAKQKDIPFEYRKIINDHFWQLL